MSKGKIDLNKIEVNMRTKVTDKDKTQPNQSDVKSRKNGK